MYLKPCTECHVTCVKWVERESFFSFNQCSVRFLQFRSAWIKHSVTEIFKRVKLPSGLSISPNIVLVLLAYLLKTCDQMIG